MKTLPDKSFDLVLTDPPYNVDLDYGDYNDKNPDYEQWSKQWFDEAIRVSNCVVFTPGMMNFNFWMKYEPTWVMCWFKSNQCSPSKLGGFNVWEPILVFGKPKKRVPQDGFSIPIVSQPQAEGHPCPKSEVAWSKLLTYLSEPDDTILDPFLGSGTTLLAAKQLNRNAVGIEISEKYCQIARERLAAQPESLFV